MLLWVLVSYVPGLWQPYVQVTDPGDVAFFRVDMLIEKEQFAEQKRQALKKCQSSNRRARESGVLARASRGCDSAVHQFCDTSGPTQ